MTDLQPFTPEQRAALGALGHIIFEYIGTLNSALVSLSMDLAAIQMLLLTKTQISPEELKVARDDMAARRTVELALHTQVRTAEEEFRRLLGEAPQ
jgi:hypothetical protein